MQELNRKISVKTVKLNALRVSGQMTKDILIQKLVISLAEMIDDIYNSSMDNQFCAEVHKVIEEQMTRQGIIN